MLGLIDVKEDSLIFIISYCNRNIMYVTDIISKMKVEKIIDESSMIYATHISHEGNDIHDVMKKLPIANGYHIAYDGLEINI